MASHRDLIVDQFTQQAVPFSTAPSIRDAEALRLLVESSGAGHDDTVLDVACGPGLVVCAFARVVRHATGIDVTPAMLDTARAHAKSEGVANVTWRSGDVTALPFTDGEFSIVCSRFAFHHFEEPAAVLREMIRVCRPGGRVVVQDLVPDPAKADRLNEMERIRDPSHTRALPLAELIALFAAEGLAPSLTPTRLESDVEGMLSRSFPGPGGADAVRRIFEETLADDGLGLGARRVGDRIRFAYPVAIVVARRA